MSYWRWLCGMLALLPLGAPVLGQVPLEYNETYSGAISGHSRLDFECEGTAGDQVHLVARTVRKARAEDLEPSILDPAAISDPRFSITSSLVRKKVYNFNSSKRFLLSIENTGDELVSVEVTIVHPPTQDARQVDLGATSYSGNINEPGAIDTLSFSPPHTQYISIEISPSGSEGMRNPRVFFYGPEGLQFTQAGGRITPRVEPRESYVLAVDDGFATVGGYELLISKISETILLEGVHRTSKMVSVPASQWRYLLFDIPTGEQWEIQIPNAPPGHVYQLFQPSDVYPEGRSTGPDAHQDLLLEGLEEGGHILQIRNDSDIEQESGVQFRRQATTRGPGSSSDGSRWGSIRSSLVLLLGALGGGLLCGALRKPRGRLVFAERDFTYCILFGLGGGLSLALVGEGFFPLLGLPEELASLQSGSALSLVTLGALVGFAVPFLWLTVTAKK